MLRQATFAFAWIIVAAPAAALAQEAGEQSTVEELASEDEAASVREVLMSINCEAETIEKENDNLFEIDDAQCEIGQYDIKLDGEFNILSMTRD